MLQYFFFYGKRKSHHTSLICSFTKQHYIENHNNRITKKKVHKYKQRQQGNVYLQNNVEKQVQTLETFNIIK